MEVGIDIKCEAGGDNSYNYDDDQTQTLRLNDDLTFTAEPFLGGLPFAAEVAGCHGCTAVKLGEPGTVTFKTPGGFLVNSAGEFNLSGQAEILLVPVIQVTCPNPDPPPATTTVTSPEVKFPINHSDFGGLPVQDGTQRQTLQRGSLGKLIVSWHSLPD